VEVYLLRPGSSGTLQQLGDPETTATVLPNRNNFQYTAPQPGVYAIVVTVYDSANNSARARKIFNYNDQPGFTMTDAPVYFRETNGSHSFVAALANKKTLVVTWAGLFVPNKPELSRRVEPWPTKPHSIDDIYGTTFGLRSVAAVDDVVGVVNASCVYLIDPKNGGRGVEEPQLDSSTPDGVVVGNCSMDLATETATLELGSSPIQNGETIIVWLKASDHRGGAGTATKKIMATVDGTRANITGQQFLKNRDDQYES